MATEQFANNAASTLAAAVGAADVTLTVAAAGTFPSSGNFRILVDSEYMLVTAVAGAVFTVTRGIESTAAAAHASGAVVVQLLTAGGLAQTIADNSGSAPTGYRAALVVSTVAALEALVGPSAKTYAWVEEFQRYFYYDTTDTTSTVDHYTVLAHTGGTNGRWKLEGSTIRLMPLGGTSDDWPRLVGAANAIAALGGTVEMGPGTWLCKTPGVFNSNVQIYGSGPLTTIIASLPTNGDTTQTVFRDNGATFGTAYTLFSNVAIGATTIVTTAPIPAGTVVVLAKSVGNQIGAMYTTGTPTANGGNFNIPLDRPTEYAYPTAASPTIRTVTNRPVGMFIDGRGMTITGTYYYGIQITGCGYKCEFKNINFDSSGGSPAAAGCPFLLDSYCYDCKTSGIHTSTPTLQGMFFAACERMSIRDCDVTGCVGAAPSCIGIFFQSCANCDGDNLRAYGNAHDGIGFGTADGTIGSVNCRLRGCQTPGNDIGVHLYVGSDSISITDHAGRGNATNGILVDNVTTAAVNTRIQGADVQYSGAAGIRVMNGCKGTVIRGADVSNAVGSSAGLRTADDCEASGIISRVNANATTGAVSVFNEGGRLTLTDSNIQSAVANWNGTVTNSAVSAATTVCRGVHVTVDDITTTTKGHSISGGSVLIISDSIVDGSSTSVSHFAVGIGSASGTDTVRIGANVNLVKTRTQLSIAGKSNRGTVTANGVTPVAVAWPDLNANDRVVLTPSTAGGGAFNPSVVYTPATGFSIQSVAGDALVYNYEVV